MSTYTLNIFKPFQMYSDVFIHHLVNQPLIIKIKKMQVFTINFNSK